ncbi:MAG: hypothetical protein ABFS22_09505 [Pseudomonadota bacterium]
MATSNESITLTPTHHDKLGLLHCGVTREGFVAVAGDTADITDGEAVEFERTHVTVKRTGSDYTFTHHS